MNCRQAEGCLINSASFAVLGELCANVSLFLTTDSFRAKLARVRKARKGMHVMTPKQTSGIPIQRLELAVEGSGRIIGGRPRDEL